MAQDETKIAAIKTGGDWFDAQVDHVVIPTGMDLEAQYEVYSKWWSEVYYALIPGTHRRRFPEVKHRSFAEWLTDETEARLATSEDVEVIWGSP